MFLVGLTGSAIPYLLFMGVLIVLALGTNTEVLNEKSAVDSEEKLISVQSDTDNTSLSDTDYDYSHHPFTYTFQSKKATDDMVCTNDEAKYMVDDFRIAFSNISPVQYNSNFQLRYFGLSPPCWS